MNSNFIRIPVAFVVYLLLQVLLFRRIVLFDSAFCLVYIGFILFLPLEITTFMLMLFGFTFGIALDLFQNSPGLHAGATVAVAFVRNSWLSLITPQGGYDDAGSISIRQYGVVWLLTYLVPMVFIHQAILFFAEAGGFQLFGLTMLKVLSSMVFTLVVVFLYQLVAVRR